MSSRRPSRSTTSSSSSFVPNDDSSPIIQLIPGNESLDEARASFKLINNNIVVYIFTNYILFLSCVNPEHRWLLTKPLWDQLWSHSINIEQEIRACESHLIPGKECVVALSVDHSCRFRYHACLRSINSTEVDRFDLIDGAVGYCSPAQNISTLLTSCLPFTQQ